MLLLTGISVPKLENLSPRKNIQTETFAEALYLPKIEAVTLLSFGHTNALAQILWFNTMSYFGKHYRSDQKYVWLAHMCDLVTQLDQRNTHFYSFCSMMLAWEAHDVASANQILLRAINSQPENWYWRYLRGFNASFFENNAQRAQDEFVAASQLPNHPPFIARLAARKVEELQSREAAIDFLRSTIARTQEESVRHALRSRLNELLSKKP
jgi:hypothetical protein